MRLSDALAVPSSISIHDPELIANSHGDFRARISVSGFREQQVAAFGACAFQAASLAFDMAKIVLSSHEDEWEFHFGEGGPISFLSLAEGRPAGF
ncbi:MAG: hypothetical protein ACOVMO_06355 [Caulobacter sp.]